MDTAPEIPSRRGVAGRAIGLIGVVAGAIAAGLLPAFAFVGRTSGPEGAWLFGAALALLCVLALFFFGIGALAAGCCARGSGLSPVVLSAAGRILES